MKNSPILSLCMPTNGVVEWVFPVLDSIYSQNVDNDLFEVVITDNGNNQEFKQQIKCYLQNHTNITYAETMSLPFMNEIEAYKRAKGSLIKFVNHRTKLVQGALQKIVDFAIINNKNKPIIYFSNGVLKLEKKCYEYDSFDMFVRSLSYWSSWSTGMTIWKSDFDRLSLEVEDFNELFPHTTVLFNERNRNKYIIDNTVIFDEIPQKKKPKGNYDLFGAFGIEYIWIICTLLRDGSITSETFRSVADENLDFIVQLYWDYCVKKQYCSYDLSGFDNMIGVFYSKQRFKSKLYSYAFKRTFRRLVRK